MNRAKLLKLLSGLGYTGKSELADIKAYIEAQGIDLRDSAGKAVDIAAVFNAKTVHVMADAGEDVQMHEPPEAEPAASDAPPPAAKAAVTGAGYSKVGKVEAKNVSTGWTPEADRNRFARKTYDRKANAGLAAHSCADEAEAVGAWFRLAMSSVNPYHADYPQKTADLEISKKTLTTGGIGTGEALVPPELVPTLIYNLEKYGACRKVAPVLSISQHTVRFPRVVADATAGVIGEGVAITAQNAPTTNNVEIVTKKIGGMIQISAELMNDAVINVADLITESAATALAYFEDQMYFIGDGTSTYGGIYGVSPALKGLSATIANIAGLFVATGNLFSEFVLSDFRNTVALLPQYADNDRACWVMSRTVAHSTAFRLQDAAGGNNRANLAGEKAGESHLGYPVAYAQVMPKVDANSQVAALFGDFSRAAKAVQVGGSMGVVASDQRYFDQDIVAFRFTERFGVGVHDVGNASATAASRVPGAVVGLISAAS